MGAWTKIFTDNSVEHGFDSDIKAGKASWSQGRLTNISKVQISEKLIEGVLSVPNTDWHHFDRYEAQIYMGQAVSTRVFRVIQAKITCDHFNKYICYNIDNTKFVWASIEEEPPKDKTISCIKINEILVNKWISLGISLKKCFLFVGERGSLNGHKQIS